MTQPTWGQWRFNSSPITNTGGTILVPQHTIRERALAALAAYVSQQNPDGTAL